MSGEIILTQEERENYEWLVGQLVLAGQVASSLANLLSVPLSWEVQEVLYGAIHNSVTLTHNLSKRVTAIFEEPS